MHPVSALEQMKEFYIGDFMSEEDQKNEKLGAERLKVLYFGVPTVAVLAIGFLAFKYWKRSH